jgi:hypothetical protein
MSIAQLEKRLAAVEAELAKLKNSVQPEDEGRLPWWRRITGRFEGDRMYARAMKLGKEYRKGSVSKAR